MSGLSMGCLVCILFMMFRGGQGGSVMNVGRAKVKDQQDGGRKGHLLPMWPAPMKRRPSCRRLWNS